MSRQMDDHYNPRTVSDVDREAQQLLLHAAAAPGAVPTSAQVAQEAARQLIAARRETAEARESAWIARWHQLTLAQRGALRANLADLQGFTKEQAEQEREEVQARVDEDVAWLEGLSVALDKGMMPILVDEAPAERGTA